MSDPSLIDYLNDPLLVTPDETPKAERTPLTARAEDTLRRTVAFVEKNGREPVSERGRDVNERMLANELAGLRASRKELGALAEFDTHGIVFNLVAPTNPLDDPLLSDDVDIFETRDALKPVARPDHVADRRSCPDFDRFKPLFALIRRSIEAGDRQPQPFRQEKVSMGEFFALKGQIVHVADLREEHKPNGRTDARLRVIFDNATESDLLMSSLVRRLYEDKDARRLGTLEQDGPLFTGQPTGFVYVLRSLSDRREVQGLLKVGTTAGSVADRVARAETQATFLYAPVEIVDTYEFIGHSAKEAEKRIHETLRRHHVDLKVVGPDGRRFSATEWFKITREAVGIAIRKSL